MRIGLIADTHGLLRPEALRFLDGCDHIVHAGDIGGPEILERLAALAPLTAVRGNNDTAPWTRALPAHARIALGGAPAAAAEGAAGGTSAGIVLYAIHDLKEIDIDPAAEGIHVVVSGHSHRPACARRGGVLYVNPGSAGRRRFSLPISAAELRIDGGAVDARLVTLVEIA